MLSKSRYRFASGVALACVLLVGVAVSVGSDLRRPSHPVDEWLLAEGDQDKEIAAKLDEIPGLRYSPFAALEDEAVAAWQAYRREVNIAECMAKAGFSHTPELRYPSGVLPAIRDYAITELGSAAPVIDPESLDRLSPEEANEQARLKLDRNDLDTYWQTRVGESLERIEEFEANHGEVAEGGEDFANGGCTAEASRAIPSIWEFRRLVFDRLSELPAIAPDPLALAELQDCAGLKVNSLKELEEQVIETKNGDQRVEECMATYGLARTNQSLARILDVANSFPEELGAQRTAFADVGELGMEDSAFLEVLFREAALVDQAALDSHDHGHAHD